ncbi:MAG: glycine zipper family protein [Actinomycetota bacterium]|nr:glycine zipper family protein [Actinomycetota bacterium]
MLSRTEAVSGYPVASFASYAEAEVAVDSLAADGFSVERLRIVAEDLRVSEKVVGHKDYPQALVEGATYGAALGALFGFAFGAMSWIAPLISGLLLAIYGLVLGALAGAVVGLVMHWASRGRRQLVTVAALEAGRYELRTVTPEDAEEARRRLGVSDEEAEAPVGV